MISLLQKLPPQELFILLALTMVIVAIIVWVVFDRLMTAITEVLKRREQKAPELPQVKLDKSLSEEECHQITKSHGRTQYTE